MAEETFKQAFRSARDAGVRYFYWKGKKYTTRYKEEDKDEKVYDDIEKLIFLKLKEKRKEEKQQRNVEVKLVCIKKEEQKEKKEDFYQNHQQNEFKIKLYEYI